MNKKSEAFAVNDGVQTKVEESMTSKWGLASLKKHFDKEGIDYDKVFLRIKDVLIKALIAVEPHVVNNLNR